MVEKESNPKVKVKVKPKVKVKVKVKVKSKVKDKVKVKDNETTSKEKIKPKIKPKKKRILIEITPLEKENDPLKYSDKLKHLIHKIKNQNNYNDTGIRFAWKN